jgi:1,4-dihydroxy-2-naphthoate octaprenyltransferase
MATQQATPPNNMWATWHLYWRMTRPGFLSITAVGCALGLVSAAACGCGFDWVRASITVLLALLAHAGANVLNDYCDELNGADAANTGALLPFTGGSRFIQNGHVSAQDTHRWAFTLLGISALGGMWLALQSGGGLLLVGLAGMAFAWAYSAPPFKLMSRGLGELTVALAWWLVVIGADYSQRGHFFIIPAYVGVSFAL